MKSWLKQQVTEITAWAGLFLILASILHLPWWVFSVVGILLICTDDVAATDWLKRNSPAFQRWIDSV